MPEKTRRIHLLAVAGATTIVGVALARGFAIERAASVGFWGTVVGTYVALALVALAWAARAEELDFVLPRWGDMTRGFFAAAAFFGLAYVGAKLTLAGTPREAWLTRLYQQIGDPVGLRARFALTCAVILIASAAEEVLWRGAITRALEPTFGSRRAWLVSAALYAMAHLPTIAVMGNPALFLAALAMGLAMGALTRVSEDRVPPAVVAHTLFDIGATLMFRLVGNSG